MKFVPGAGLHGELHVEGGRLLAQGTGANPIVFTSYFDDTAGGDTDGGGRAPERGDWANLSFGAPTAEVAATMLTSVLENVSVRYGGAGYSCVGGNEVGVGGWGKLEVLRSEFIESQTTGVGVGNLNSGGYASVSHNRFAESPCGMVAQSGDVFNNIFEASLSNWSLYSSSGSAKDLRVIGNWMYQGAAFTLNGTREKANVMANAFIAGVNNEYGDQDHEDLRYNAWGGPRAYPGQCVTYQSYVPAVDSTGIPGDCPVPQQFRVKKFFTQVLPMWGAPPVPEVGPGATITPPGGLPVGGVPAGQTFGGDCDCSDPIKDLQHKTQRPVNTATGSLVEFFTDISLPGLGVPLTWTRTYNSLDITTGPMGPGWTFGYNASVLPWGSKGALLVRAGDGKQVIFEPKIGGGFQTPPGVRSVLTAATGGGYRLTKLDRSYVTFDSSGRLTEMRDYLDQGLSLGYANSKLSTITDAAGRVITLTYTGDLLTRVALPGGRDVEYSYTDGYLTGAIDLRGRTTSFTYDVNNFLKSAQDPNGHFLFRNTYDPETGRVVSQLDPRGKETTFAWNQPTQTSTMTDPDGGEWVEVYENNLLVERRDPLGNSLKYGYDDKLNRISVIDANNKETRFTFDAEGNMLTRTASATLSYQEVWTYTAFSTVDSYTNGRGKVTDYDYDPSQRLVRITDPLNRATEFTHTAQGQIDTITDPRNKVTDFGYDADGNRTSVLSPEGNLTTFTFDGSGRMLSRTEPRGNVAGANPAEFTTEFTYNNADQPLTVTDALDRVTTYTYDDAGNLDTLTDADTKVTDVDYDADNQVTTVTDPRGAVTSTTYDDRGNLASVTTAASTPQAGKTMFVYDAANRVKHKITPRGNVTGADPAPFTWTYTYDANGNLETETNPTAGTIAYAYDELNRRTSTTDALTHETGFGYDANSNLTSVTDPLNRVTSYVFDDADQLDKVTDANGKVTDYDYDGSGNHTALTTPMGFQTRWTYDADGRLASQVDPRGTQTGAVPSEFTTTYAYDPAGHLTLVTDPLNHATTYAYDRVENLKTRTDANNHTTTYTYDVLDRLKTVTGPSNTGTTSYGYDAAGNLNTRTNAKNQVTTFDHDLAGRLKTKTTPIGTWTHTYDAAGNPKTTTTAAGNTTPADGNDATITRSYDPLDRLSGINYSDATPDVSYAYDQLRLASMTDAAGTETYDYDPAGQLQTVTRGGALFDYDYDTLGRINKRTHPDGTVVNQSWDDDSRPLALSSGAASATHQYDAAGNPIQASLGNGLTETRTYNRAGWLSDTVTKRPGNAIVAQHTMTRDNVGNPTQIVRRYDTLMITESYTYDPADRVTKACFGADCGERVEYTYDELGNRLTENRVDGIFSGLLTIGSGLVTSTYNDKNQLTQTTRPGALLQPPVVTNYGYDDNGNQTTQAPSTGGSTTYAYDLENRLKTATIGSATTSYAHDGNGLRRTATTGAATTSYTWDTNYPLPELAAETTSGATRQFLNNATGDPVAITNPGTGATTGLHYLHLDELGSVRTATDPAANVTNTYAYEPFGTSRYSPTSQNAITNPIGFAGEYKDPATGLYHLRARDYDTTTGRFTTLDPIAQDITDPYVAEYVYVKNRPTVFLDPSGLSEEVCTDGPWWQEVGEAICDTGEAIHSAITHPADTVAGAGHVGYQIQEFSVHGLLMKASGIDMSDFYDQAVADQFGVDVTGEAFAVGQVIGWEVCTLGVGGLVANGARASLRALAADRATGPARLGSLLFGIPGVGATSRLFGDIHSGAVRPGLLQGTSTLGLGWSGKRVVVDGKKRARTVFRGKYHGRKFDLWHGPWR